MVTATYERLSHDEADAMAQLAAKIRDFSAGYLDKPVVDLTGLKGAYDFTLTWMPINRLQGNPNGPKTGGDSSSPIPVASDRPVGLTLF